MNVSHKIAIINGMGSKIKYLYENNNSTSYSMLKNTYQEIATDIYNIAEEKHLNEVSVYTLSGELKAFYIRNPDESDMIIGYSNNPSSVYIQTLKPGEDSVSNKWKQTDTLSDVKLKFDGEIPKDDRMFYSVSENFLCVFSYMPVLSDAYNAKTMQLEKQQFGFVLSKWKIDKAFLSRMSRLTSLKLNIFTKDGISIGDMDDYRQLISDHKLLTGAQKILLNDIKVNDKHYFQGILPFSDNSDFIGAIVALEPLDIIRKNTLQIIQIFGMVFIVSAILIIPLAVKFSNSLSKPIYRIADGLADSAYRLSSVADEIASMSQSLSRESDSLAASVEESSASLTEMTYMSRESTEVAGQADQLMNENIEKSAHALEALVRLSQSMSQVESDSDQIIQIIKSIDEIAFRTNLLSLNAAVEAARAGEAGAGFAVVADEVRNLAVRSAKAAKNTQELLRSAIQNVTHSSHALKEMSRDFEKIIESATVMGEKTSAITKACREQLRGIEQVSSVANITDNICQQVAVDLQKSASASEEMHAKAEQMQRFVDELIILIEG